MLYDPKWEKQTETKADIYSMAGLIAWLEKQPPDTGYEFSNCGGGCLIGMYYVAMGVHDKSKNSYRAYVEAFGDQKNKGAYGYVCASHPYTFGAALERAIEWLVDPDACRRGEF